MDTYPAPTDTTPGWKSDPSGRHEHRYWDGMAWTPNVATGGHAQSEDGGPGGVAGAPQWGGAPQGAWGPAPQVYSYGGIPQSGEGWIPELQRPAAPSNKRIFAALIDFAVGFAVNLVIGFAFASSALVTSGDSFEFSAGLGTSLALNGVTLLLWAAWTVGGVAVWGGSPGKLAMGLRVVRLDGQPVTWGTAASRFAINVLYVVPLVSLLLLVALVVNLVLVFTDDRRQSIYDKIAKTAVVPTR